MIDHLKQEKLAADIQLQSDLLHTIRNHLHEEGFTEVSTPILSFPTKEYGEGEFVVVSKLQPGKFYALPHSPQLYKQFLMGAFGESIAKYFQIAWNFRPEIGDDTHGQEFRQIDFEIVNSDLNAIISTIEKILSVSFALINVSPNYTNISYAEALKGYGSSSPDFRYIGNAFAYDRNSVKWDISLTDVADSEKLQAIAKQFEDVEQFDENSLVSFRTNASLAHILGEFRNAAIKQGSIKIHSPWAFLWLTDLPLFRLDQNGALHTFHHPQMIPTSAEDFWSAVQSGSTHEILSLCGSGCDLIVNGMEVAGGNVRNHDVAIQKKILELIGITPETSEIHKPLLSLLQGFPNYRSGGAAVGFERLVLLLTGNRHLIDSQAFPLGPHGEEFFGGPFTLSQKVMNTLGVQLNPAILESSREESSNKGVGREAVLSLESLVSTLCGNSAMPEQLLRLKIASHWLMHEPEDALRLFHSWAKKECLDERSTVEITNILTALQSNNISRQDKDPVSILLNVKKLYQLRSFIKVDLPKNPKISPSVRRVFLAKIIKGYELTISTELGRKMCHEEFNNIISASSHLDNEKQTNRTIIALGGAETISNVFIEFDKAFLQTIHKEEISLYYLPIAMFQKVRSDEEISSYAEKVAAYFSRTDERVRTTWAVPTSTVSAIKEQLATADIIYISGGDTAYLIQRLKEDFAPELLNAYQKGAVIIGNSAGILALTKTSFSFADKASPKELSGMGILKKYSVIVHYQKTMNEALAIAKKKLGHVELVALEENEIAVFNNEELAHMQKMPL